MLKSTPQRMAMRDVLICLGVCGFVVITDCSALADPLRVVILCVVVGGVPLVNYVFNRRRGRKPTRLKLWVS